MLQSFISYHQLHCKTVSKISDFDIFIVSSIHITSKCDSLGWHVSSQNISYSDEFHWICTYSKNILPLFMHYELTFPDANITGLAQFLQLGWARFLNISKSPTFRCWCSSFPNYFLPHLALWEMPVSSTLSMVIQLKRMRLESILSPAINDGTQDRPFLAIGASDFPTEPADCRNTGTLSETYLKLNHHQIVFVHN